MIRPLTRPLLVFLVWTNLALAQNNILNNGGFESGLMCYSQYVWSATGAAYGDGYQFLLSNDAHSGNYSLEINCNSPNTSNCAKAAIISDRIPAPANQTYTLSFYSKCPASAFSFVYIPGMATGDMSSVFTCNNTWNFTKVSLTTGTTAGYLYYVFYNADKSWLLVDDVVLTFGDGTAPTAKFLHPGQRDVRISGQTVFVDRSPFLSLGFFDVGYNDLAQVAALGANTINGLPSFNAASCFNTGQKSYLDEVYELGMNFVPDSTTTARLLNAPLFSGVARTYAPHLANIGWLLADEPDLSSITWEYIPPATFIAEHNALQTQTSLPILADFQRASYGAVTDIVPYNHSADIWMAEPYGSDFGPVNYAIDLFNAVQLRPIWLAQDDIDASLIVPKAYWAIIAGATGIHYFSWNSFQSDPTKLAAAKQVFSELKGLTKAIFGTQMDSLITAPHGVASMSRYDPSTNAAYILSATSTSATVTGAFHVQGLEAGKQITVLNENRTITSSAGSFTDTFAGASRHVYEITCAASGPAVQRRTKSFCQL